MKIQSNSRVHFGQLIKFSNGIKIQFDRNGVAEVSNDQGKFLLEKYTGLLFPEGKPPKVEKIESPRTDANSSEVEVLKEKLTAANHLVSQYKQDTAQAKEGEGIWRKKCDELLLQVKGLEDKILPTGEEVDEEDKILTFINWFVPWQTDKNLSDFEVSDIYDAFGQSFMDSEESEEEKVERLKKEEEEEKKKLEDEEALKLEEEKGKLKVALEKKKMPELQGIAKELKLPEESWKDLLKDSLIDYIVDETMKNSNA